MVSCSSDHGRGSGPLRLRVMLHFFLKNFASATLPGQLPAVDVRLQDGQGLTVYGRLFGVLFVHLTLPVILAERRRLAANSADFRRQRCLSATSPGCAGQRLR